MPIDAAARATHSEKCLLSYVKVRDKYLDFAASIRNILSAALTDYSIHTIQARAKDFDSFAKKSAKIDKDSGELKYLNPLDDLTDLAGVRIITYVQQTIRDIEEVIRNEFSIVERSDKDAALLDAGRIGYKSIHFLVKIKDPRINSSEYAQFKDMVAEIQVRTILQHAWAEMEHDIQYKSDQQIPNELRRRFIALAGLLEITDREFESIQKEDDKLRAMLTIELVEEISLLPPSQELVGGVANPAISTAAAKPDDAEAELIFWAALDRYNNLIKDQPGQYAHFLGRAKAKFLLGDRFGALEDVSAAEVLAPQNEHVATVRQKIEEGSVDGRSSYNAALIKYLDLGNSHLEKGDYSAAFTNYNKCVQLGAKKRLSTLALAMCAFLQKDFGEMSRHLAKYSPQESTMDWINQFILITLAKRVAAPDAHACENAIAELGQIIHQAGFDMQQSPIRYLESGIRSTFLEEEAALPLRILAACWRVK